TVYLEKQADIAKEQGQRAEAAALYTRLIEQLEAMTGSGVGVTDLVRLAAVHRKRAEALDDSEGEYQEAVECAKRACRMQAGSDAARIELCRAITALGSYLNRVGREQDASNILDRASELTLNAGCRGSDPWRRLTATVHGERGKGLLVLG